MSFAARHNKANVFECNTEGFIYKSLEELYNENGADQEYPIQGFYINHKSDYGDAPVAIGYEYFINFPQFMLEEVLDIMKSTEDVEDLKTGKVGFKIETYEKELKKTTKTCYAPRWVDLA